MTGLRSRVVLITGAASGLGRAIAFAFAKHGAKLALVENKVGRGGGGGSGNDSSGGSNASGTLHTNNKLQRISKDCAQLGASGVFCCQHDLTSREGVREALEQVTDTFSRQHLSVLVNNSALLHPEHADSASIDDDDAFQQILTANVIAAVRFSQLSVPYLTKASQTSATGGSIVNVNGPQITVNSPGAALAHKMCQGAMDELTRAMAIDLAPKGIRVNAIQAGGTMALTGKQTAGPVLTLRHLDSALNDPEDMSSSSSGGGHGQHFGLSCGGGGGKTGSSNDVAEAVRFLASDEASFVTGQTIPVDGGASLVAHHLHHHVS